MKMDNPNGCLTSIIGCSGDHQTQTFVTKHDLALLHKKIIATDLIVQKYQEANRALVTLQAENEQLRQQVDQITHECCIFGKQVTECTQECDHLKEQIDKLNAEKRQMFAEINHLKDSNTNYYHEIMVLRQYESLKHINDESTRTIERQQKEISKLQLKLQRQTPTTFRSNKDNQDSTELKSNLVTTQKSVRELKLALGRLMNYLYTTKVEIPSSLNIRPVLIAHSINDDFLEIEGEFVLKPMNDSSQQIIHNHHVSDCESDCVDATRRKISPSMTDCYASSGQTQIQILSVESGESKKNKETSKNRKTKKPLKKKNDTDIDDLDELATQLDMAISQSDHFTPSPTMRPISFLTDDEEETIQDELNQTEPMTPTIPIQITRSETPESMTTQSTIEFTRRVVTKTDELPNLEEMSVIARDLSSLTDDDEEEIETNVVSSIITATLAQKHETVTVPFTAIEPNPPQTSRLISCLSEDDELPTETTHDSQFHEDIVDHEPSKLSEVTSDTEQIVTEDKQSPNLDSMNQEKNQSDKESPLPIDTPTTETCHKENPVAVEQRDIDLSHDSNGNSSKAKQLTIFEEKVQLIFQFFNSTTKFCEYLTPLSHLKVKVTSVHQPKTPPSKKLPDDDFLDSKSPSGSNVESSTLADTNASVKIIQDSIPTHVDAENNMAETVVNEVSTAYHVIHNTTNISDESTTSDITRSNLQEFSSSGCDSTFSNKLPGENNIASEQIIANINTLSKSASEKEHTDTCLPELISSDSKRSLNSLSTKISDSTIEERQYSLVIRLLELLTTLPSKPSTFQISTLTNKRKRQSNTTEQLSYQAKRMNFAVGRPTPVMNRMQTRSLPLIRASIARCNRPQIPVTPKRPAPNDSSISTANKRIKKTTLIETEQSPLEKHLRDLSKSLSTELQSWIKNKLEADIAKFIDEFYQTITEVTTTQCDIILPLVNRLHPCEESLKIVLQFINSKSSTFRDFLIHKFNESFRRELDQRSMTSSRLKLSNRLFLLVARSLDSSKTVFYGRLFDIGYYYSRDVLSAALLFVKQNCSIVNQENSSDQLLHNTFYDMFTAETKQTPLEYIENILMRYFRKPTNYDDLVRSLILICRQQTWHWCSEELFSKLMIPLTTKLQQCSTILTVIQCIIWMYKDDAEFRKDSKFCAELRNVLQSLEIKTEDESIVRDKIHVMLDTCFK